METTEEIAVAKKSSHVYDVVAMTVTAWGNVFTYKHYDPATLKDVPDEVKLYALKGFIDDLQDCTVSIKKADYAKTPEGTDKYRADCLAKRRELEGHINAGTRPARANGTGNAENKALLAKVKETLASTVVSMESLMAKKMFAPNTFTEEDQLKLDEFLMVVAERGRGKGKGK